MSMEERDYTEVAVLYSFRLVNGGLLWLVIDVDKFLAILEDLTFGVLLTVSSN